MNETTFRGDGKVVYVPVVVSAKQPKPTNADRIRAMSDEEMARLFTDDWCEIVCGSPAVCGGNCEKNIFAWLKQEASE